MSTQSDVRTKRLAGFRAELAGLRAQFEKTRKDVAEAVKKAAKRRDDWLLEHTRKEHL
ncbi:MAG TPA: hypothetical protein VLC10_05435 [Patescibacteria group bacterium]|nr:hypothetical protein [Patescibacteria group bacterium]